LSAVPTRILRQFTERDNDRASGDSVRRNFHRNFMAPPACRPAMPCSSAYSHRGWDGLVTASDRRCCAGFRGTMQPVRCPLLQGFRGRFPAGRSGAARWSASRSYPSGTPAATTRLPDQVVTRSRGNGNHRHRPVPGLPPKTTAVVSSVTARAVRPCARGRYQPRPTKCRADRSECHIPRWIMV